MLHSAKYLTAKKALTKNDVIEIIQLFQFESMKAMDGSIILGEHVPANYQKFYIIIKGVVSVKT